MTPPPPFAFVGADVFDGVALHQGRAVLVADQRVSFLNMADIPEQAKRRTLEGGTLMPGFVDLQVNGGGGVMFNAAPTAATLERMALAHAGLGTCAMLPTLITDTPEVTQSAIRAVVQALSDGVSGIIGLHLEGPHLAVARKGAHAGDLIRPMNAADLAMLLSAADVLPNLMVTVAPETVSAPQIRALASAGVIVSLGHSDCSYDVAMRAFDAGARCTTHLFNAMSQLTSRAPGLVGATLNNGAAAGLIADGIHVDPATIRTALAAKTGPQEVFLVTDAMACAGAQIDRFTLNGREILRRNGQLTLADGTLAGADLSMARALDVMTNDVGDDPAKAMARATSIPAALLREDFGFGCWPDQLSGLIYLDAAFDTAVPASRLG